MTADLTAEHLGQSPRISRTASPASTGTALLRACHHEWRHLAALRSTWVLVAVVGVLSLATGPLVQFEDGTAVQTDDVVESLRWSAGFLQVPALAYYVFVFGTGPVATDLCRGAARTTWLTAGSRTIAYCAKAVTSTIGIGAVAVASAVLGVLSVAATLPLYGAEGPDWSTLWQPTGAFVLWMLCWALLCTAVASLIANRVGPVLILCLWPILGERAAGYAVGIVPGLEQVGDWLPFAAGRAMLVDVDAYSGDDRDVAEMAVGTDISPTSGLLVFVAFTVAVTTAGLWRYRHRDTT